MGGYMFYCFVSQRLSPCSSEALLWVVYGEMKPWLAYMLHDSCLSFSTERHKLENSNEIMEKHNIHKWPQHNISTKIDAIELVFYTFNQILPA